MKKLLIIASLLFAGAAVQAQDFKPTAGSVTTEFGLWGGISDTQLELNEGALRFRYFHKENLAFRLGFNVDNNREIDYVYGPNDEEGKFTSTNNQLTINIGAEKHFAGTDRLSPYVGADFLLGFSKETEKYEDNNNGIYTADYNTEWEGDKNTRLGLRAVIGADYYIAKHLFLGAEAGLTFSSTKFGDEKFTDNTGETKTFQSEGGFSNFNTGMNAAIRIGFVF